MLKKLNTRYVFFVAIIGLIFTASCTKKAIVSAPSLKTPSVSETVAAATKKAKQEEAKRQKAIEAERRRQEETKRRRAIEEERLRTERLKKKAETRKLLAARTTFLNENIYFEFDGTVLISTARDVLQRKAKWLRNNPEVSVTLEGHCDERGTSEYNLALGDKRAASAKNYLTWLGISPSRLTTISFGKERPVDRDHNENAWARNRRVHFVIQE